MSAAKRIRIVGLLIWLLLALLTAGSVFAQGDEGTPQGEDLAVQAAPEDLDDIAVRLTPLLVGAALIERTLEFLFNWVERAVIDATHWLNTLAARLTGLVQIDLRKAWDDLDNLTSAIGTRKMSLMSPVAGNPSSANPADWPLALLEVRIAEAKTRLEQAENVLKDAMKSPLYTSRKKMAAAALSMVFGVLMAITADLRLFNPLGVNAAGWFETPFETFDLVLAGLLMGLGTDWVHQVIGLLIQGKGFLGRAGGSQVDTEQVRQLAQLVVQEQFETRVLQLRDELVKEIKDIRPPT